MDVETLHVGLDDTDSMEGGCTTYVAWRIVEDLDCELLEPPNLVRLNPTVPWKTRGNGALALRMRVPDADEAIRRARDTLEVHREPGSDSGFVAFEGPLRGAGFDRLYEKGVTDLLKPRDVEPLLDRSSVVSYGDGRGLLGASAAICWAPGDYTYELIAYRNGPRQVDPRSLREAGEVMGTWDTLDGGKPVCVPSTPCPVLLGLRGDSRDAVESAWQRVRASNVEGFQIFKTNQGTDDHLVPGKVGELRPYRSYVVQGEVAEAPRTIEGGHVFFVLASSGGELDCAAYEPTKDFRHRVRRLRRGDRIEVAGSFRGNGALNLEKLEVLSLIGTELRNPVCPSCGRSMESAGRDQGYRCRGCSEEAASKREVKVNRELREGKYEVPPSARRHLSRPLERGAR